MASIKLDNNLLIGQGVTRYCFRHPDKEWLCIKVDKKPRDKVTLREITFLKRFERRGISWDMLSEYYGKVDTDRGTGYVFRLIRDADGSVSSTLRYYLLHEYERIDYRKMREAFFSFRHFLIDQKIQIFSLLDYNVVYQKVSADEGRIVLIDSIGNNQFLPTADYLGFLAKRVIKRKWYTFEKRLMRDYGNNDRLVKIIEELRRYP
ncbi:MAG: YrbL family protein [Chlorobiales bacterium]|nr:YrbL family protein [Chlorobiales bacterium]